MNKAQARNVVALIQKEPFYYRNFGIWWWHVKRQLKKHGYDKDQLYCLGDFHDPTADDYYEGLSEEQLDNEAYDYQYIHAVNSYNSTHAMTPDGEVYHTHDQDAE